MSLYESAVKRPIMTALCFIAVVIFGIFSFSKLPIDLMPDIETNTMMVITSYSGASASDIENNVTRPLENTLNSVEHLKHITSNSRENISIITLEFEFGYDIDVLTNDVRDKLDMVESALPDDAENMARALLLLEENGYITLKEGAGLEAKLEDVEKNDRGFELKAVAHGEVASSGADILVMGSLEASA